MAASTLYVAYRPEWGDNRACDLLRRQGWDVEVTCPARGDRVPATPRGYAGVMIGGALDDVVERSRPAYVDRLIGLARACLERDVPCVGFCFGAQVLAAAGGGRVLERADGRGALGYRRVLPAGARGRELLAGLDRVCHLHYHGFEAPAGAVRLAAGSLFPDAAFRLGGRAFGFQFHPEIRADQLEAVVAHLGPGALERRGADPLASQLADAVRHEDSIQHWMEGFLGRCYRPG